MDDGYPGLRVVAEVSDLAADPATRREPWSAGSTLADDLMARGSGFTAMCAYRGDLAREALADVASVHPLVRAPGGRPAVPVFLDGDRIVLAGSVDTFSARPAGARARRRPAGATAPSWTSPAWSSWTSPGAASSPGGPPGCGTGRAAARSTGASRAPAADVAAPRPRRTWRR